MDVQPLVSGQPSQGQKLSMEVSEQGWNSEVLLARVLAPKLGELSAGEWRISSKADWCQWEESNFRPRAYESPALPLSYTGTDSVRSGRIG